VGCWAIVAVKSRVHCKRRLSAVLEPQERLELVRRMLDHVLAAAAGSTHVDRVLVVSPERDDLRESIDLVTDAGIGLNEALELARGHARAQGAREIVVLPADLPRLATEDVDALIAAGRGAGVAIAPDRRHAGTNALYLPASADVAFSFGARSLHAHIARARSRGFEPSLICRAGFEFDIDMPEDLLTPADLPRPQSMRSRWSWSNAERRQP